MPRRDLQEMLSYARLSQLYRYGRRAVGLPAARQGDFMVQLPPGEPARLRAIATAVRGPAAPPAIFVHGVLPRSGTNFLVDALALHPHVHAHPGRLWEFPLLYVAPGAEALQREFLSMFRRNAEVMGRFDLLAYLASGWLAALQKEAGERRLLLKSPHMQNLALFRHIFPYDTLLLCLRDGRDVIQSSLNTFARWHLRSKGFAELAREWRYATEAILSFEPGGEHAYGNAKVVRYEALVEDTAAVVHDTLRHARLDPEVFDFDALRRLPVRGSSSLASRGDQRWAPHEKPKDFQPVGRWRQAWSRRAKRRFKAIAGTALIQAGYAQDDRW
ncbi:MAG: sulfotransferase family protein [Geminicoccaceae bacterium]